MDLAPSLLDVDALAQVISLSPKTIYNLLSKSPKSLPPRVVVPGAGRSVRWYSEDVVAWIKGLKRSFTEDAYTTTEQPKKRRGRPTKAEIIERGLH